MTQLWTVYTLQIIASVVLCAIFIAGAATELRSKWLLATMIPLLGIVFVTSLIVISSTPRWPAL